MTNPRIVTRHRDGEVICAVRGHVIDETFQIGVHSRAVRVHSRLRIEARLREEALGVIRIAEARGEFDWAEHGFARNEDFDIWEKTLSNAQVDRLMGDADA